jgi:hypothetical protein
MANKQTHTQNEQLHSSSLVAMLMLMLMLRRGSLIRHCRRRGVGRAFIFPSVGVTPPQ